ncbi:hypothetical protein BDY17DRAFT_305039 [Neohortaea acidophila]|uniref:Uncharacterized protein n=1 Tax=Neohortaea acidophila TaxID=245834 RepID=A0A6A6PGL7_9PEZI|nr:uncharacterized protein BDY17DRAFT_305039 [Neohortaea acidophila]KAF2479138.1 hypothetical protein BDY17DRAFT_305039 [Neohortaea acidophila]
MDARGGRREDSTAQADSSVVQNFATDLDSMFGLSHGIATLSQTVEEKKASVSSGQSELEALEARLRETEDRLRKVSRGSSPARQADAGAATSTTAAKQTSPLTHRPAYPDGRPPSASKRQQAGANRADSIVDDMRETAQAHAYNGRDEYVMVDRGYGQSR